MEIFSNKMDLTKLELFTWDFPVSLAIAKSTTLAPKLTQCLWNSLLHASSWWYLVHGARHLLISLGLNLTLCCLTGFCISEGIINHKSPALLSCMCGCWEREFNFLLLLEMWFKKIFKSTCHLDFQKQLFRRRKDLGSPLMLFFLHASQQTSKRARQVIDLWHFSLVEILTFDLHWSVLQWRSCGRGRQESQKKWNSRVEKE